MVLNNGYHDLPERTERSFVDTETDFRVPKRTLVDTETDFRGYQTDILGTEMDFSGYQNGLFAYKIVIWVA